MKKAIAILLAVSMIAGIASCSKEPERKRKKDSGKSKKTEETDDDFEDFTEETIEDIVETTRKKKKDKTKETIPVPDGAYCLDGKSPEEIVEVGKFFADIKDNDSFIDIYKRVEVAPTNYDVNSLDKYNASISFMLYIEDYNLGHNTYDRLADAIVHHGESTDYLKGGLAINPRHSTKNISILDRYEKYDFKWCECSLKCGIWPLTDEEKELINQ